MKKIEGVRVLFIIVLVIITLIAMAGAYWLKNYRAKVSREIVFSNIDLKMFNKGTSSS